MIDTTEVDGVPTLVAARPGPVRAGLMFRVGRADETLARSGTSHLIEHLAFQNAGLTDYHANGSTGAVVTEFHVQGGTDEVVEFLAKTCRALRDLPADRVETEKAIVRTEWSSRTPWVLADMPLWRHGARDYGLQSYPEWGLPMLSLNDLRQWVARYFTRENAVLWIAGDGVPAGLRLDLPGGERLSVPAPSSALPITPAYFPGPDRAVGVSAVVRRSPAAMIFAALLKRELLRSLRHGSGLSYMADTVYEPRGDGFATVLGLVDSLPQKQDAALGGFIDVLAGLRVGRIDEADLATLVGQAGEELSYPDVEAGMLPSYAFDLLTGTPLRSIDELRVELGKVTVDDLHKVAQEMMASALLMVPRGHTADWAGFTAAPTTSAAAIAGASARSLAGDERKLVVGPEGVSVTSFGAAATVRFDECAALLIWPDGGRQLIGNDGIVVRAEPTLYAVDRAYPGTVDSGVPYERHVLMPPRTPAEIPRPVPRTDRQPKNAPPPRAGWIERVGTVLVSVAAVILICLGGLVTVSIGSDKETASDAGLWGVVGAVWCLAVAVAVPAFLLLRRSHRRRRG